MYSNSNQIFKPSEINQILCDGKFIKNNKKLEYLNLPITFDIETTSFYDAMGEKCATMYAWVFGINGKCVIGRTWDEFLLILNKVKEYYQLNISKRIIIWVHNLAFEWGFMQHLFEWHDVFATDERKPVYAYTDDGLEFRCSYILSGYSLDMVSKNLTKYKVRKMVGDLDYSKLRHSKTPLTEKEYGYILHDGLVVMSYIQELLDEYGDFHKLPLTKTGFVRKYMRNECLYGGNKTHQKQGTSKAYKKYHGLMSELTIPSYDAYKQMKRVYSGGFTHANGLYSGVVLDDITSFDFCSSYPTSMIAFMYPMGKPRLTQIKSMDDLKKKLQLYCCMFNIKFYNLKPKLFNEHPLSVSKCYNIVDVIEDNGRVVSAKEISTSINEIDFDVINDFYSYDSFDIWEFRIMDKDYLPTPFVKAILKLYELKTTLKGSTSDDDLIRFLWAKGNLNSAYGMCVTDIMQLTRKYENGEWITEEPNIKEIFDKYNKSKSRFLYYAWGIWVTSYSRRNLFLGIKAVGNYYVYSDTDSIKIRNASKHLEFINNYNKYIENRLVKALNFHNIDISMIKPKTMKGETKILGIWEFDGHYKRFKTLGAKRYLVETDDCEMHLTCSGLSKSTINYMLDCCNHDNDKVFEMFNDGMYIDAKHTGKQIHTYIDFEMKGYLTDYLGNTSSYHELSGVHLEGAEYSLSLSKTYLDYLSGIRVQA